MAAMQPLVRLGHARRLVIGFVAIAGGLTVALGVLAWRFVALEEEVDRQRVEERLETVAESAASAMSAGIVETEGWLVTLLRADPLERAGLAAGLPSDSVVLITPGGTLTTHPASNLLYRPLPATGALGRPAVDATFARVDALEYRDRNLTAAAAALAELVRGLLSSHGAGS